MEEMYYVYNFCCNSIPKIPTTLEEFELQIFESIIISNTGELFFHV